MNGIKRATVENRVYQLGWDIEKAITTKVRTKKNNISAHLEIAKANGIKETTARRRIERGWDIKRAITEKTYTNEEKATKARSNRRKVIKKNKHKKEQSNYFRELNRLDFELMKR